MATSRLAQILEQEYKTKGIVGGAVSALGKRTKEKIDIRNSLFSGSGLGSTIGTKIFGKGYSATRKTNSSTSPSSPSLDGISNATLEDINTNTKITAKNTLVMPMMARDMNLVRLNIVKMVNLLGGQANRNKTDMFFSNARKREEDYERQFGKKPQQLRSDGTKKESGEGGFLSSILGFFKGGIGNIIDTLIGALIKGGLITGFLVTLGKYFRDDEFRKSVNDMLDGILKTVFGEDYKKDLLAGVGIFTGAMAIIGVTLGIFNAAVIAASRALLGLAVGSPGAGKGKGGKFSGLTGKAKLLAIAAGLGLTTKQLYDLYGGEEEANKFFSDESSNVPGAPAAAGAPDSTPTGDSSSSRTTGEIMMQGGMLGLETYAAASLISLPGGSGKSAAPSTSPKVAGPFDHLESKKLTPYGTAGENREIVKNKALLEKISEIIRKVVEKGATSGMIYKFAAKFGFTAAAKLSAVVAGIAAAPFSAGLSLLISGIGALLLVYDIYQIYDFFVELEKEMDADEKAAKVIKAESSSSTPPGPVPSGPAPSNTGGGTSARLFKDSNAASSTTPSSAGFTNTGFKFNKNQNEMASLIHRKFTEAGFTDDQATAAVVNAYAESNLNPKAESPKTDKEASYGLFQMNTKGGLGTGHKPEDLKDPNYNIDLMIKAAKGNVEGYQKASIKFRSTTSLNDAVAAFTKGFERPKNADLRAIERIALAQAITGGGSATSTTLASAGGDGARSQLATSQADLRKLDMAMAAVDKPLFSPEDLAGFAAAMKAPGMQNGGGGMTQAAFVSKATPYDRDFYHNLLKTVAL